MTPLDQTREDLTKAEGLMPAGSTVTHATLGMTMALNRLCDAVERLIAQRSLEAVVGKTTVDPDTHFFKPLVVPPPRTISMSTEPWHQLPTITCEAGPIDPEVYM